jgi:eukaryotic-like serine/threonine-protein kinase
MRSFFRFVLLALVLLVVALVSALTAMRFAIHGREVTVPDLFGKTPAEAARIADAEGLQATVERQYYSANVPEGRILSQLPPAGSQVRRGWQLRLSQSLGPQRLEIPSVLGQSERAAEMNILRRGLQLGTIAHLQQEGQQGQVISQSPPPNSNGVSGPKMSLLVTDAVQPAAFVMPSFAGQSLGAANSALQSVGLRVAAVNVAVQPGVSPAPTVVVSPGAVIVSQHPAPGEKVTQEVAVSLEVR